MKKQLLIVAAALVLAVCAQARVISPSDNQVWWGYFNESDFETGDYTVGTGQAMTLMAGIYIPANHPQLEGATIQAVRVYLSSSAVSSLSNLKIWISKELPSKVDNADVVQSVIGTLSSGINDYKLRNPYEITGEGFYIGYSVKSTTGYFIRCGGMDAPNSYFIGNPDAGMGWDDLYGYGLGKLAFQILVENGNFPNNCATVEDFGQNMALQGDITSVPITITNQGQNPINSINYTITTEGGGTTDETTIQISPLPLNGSATLSIPFLPDAETRKYKKTFTITKVNGEDNTAKANSGTGFLITLKEKQPVTPVIEEFTGTWCGWCPRGTVGMEKVREAYGDQVVQIAVHNGDPMQLTEYQTVVNKYVGGFPDSYINRQIEADPSYASLASVLNMAFAKISPASVDLYAEWEDNTQKKVVFNTTTRFSYNDDNGQYALAFVLVEDGLKGTGSNWAQSNYYSGQGSGEMAWWGNQGSSVTGVEYNHVAVAAWSVLDGVSGSVNPVIDANTPQQYTYTGSIASNSIIQDKSKLKAVVLLFDCTNGTIVNAAQSPVMEKGTGVSSVAPENGVPSAIYSVDGRQLPMSQKGLNIIRMTDGTVKKVLVK